MVCAIRIRKSPPVSKNKCHTKAIDVEYCAAIHACKGKNRYKGNHQFKRIKGRVAVTLTQSDHKLQIPTLSMVTQFAFLALALA